MKESSKDDDTCVEETQFEEADIDGDLEDFNEEVETIEPNKEGKLKRKLETQQEGKEWSECWQYFDKVYKLEDDGVERKYGQCHHCRKFMKADTKRNGTSGLKKHLKCCEVNPEVRAKKQNQSNLVFNKVTSGEGGSSVNVWIHDDLAIKEALLEFFVCAEVPFKLVEHWAFVKLVNRLNGKVKLPSRHVRCMAHILNLIVKDGFCNQVYHVNCVQKAVKYIRHSTQRITKFKECMKKEKLESQKFLCGDCPTRWNSTYDMLKIAVSLEKVFSKYESADPSYERDLGRIPDRDDFKACEKMVKFLEKFKDKTEMVSATSKPLSHLFIREVLDVDNHLRVWETDVDFCTMLGDMREKFKKYWGSFDKLNDYFYFAVILDPTMKSGFLSHCFRVVLMNKTTNENPMSKSVIEKMVGVLIQNVESRLERLFKTYQARFETANSGSQETRNEEDAIISQGKNDFFADYLQAEGNTLGEVETEFIRYLNEPKVNFKLGFDILKWWRLNGNRFPIVSRMARDILAIQVSSVASESAFSTGGRVLDSYRTRLSTNIVEALICTQDWVKKSNNTIFLDQVDDILNDDDIAMEIEEAINNQNDKGKEQILVEE